MAGKRNKGEGSWNKKVINGKEYFHYRKKYGNKYKDFYGKTKKETQEKIAKFETTNGLLSSSENKKLTIDEFIYIWMETKSKTLKPTSYDALMDTIRLYVLKELSGYQLSQLDENILQKHINGLADKHSLRTVKKAYDCLNQSLDYAMRLNYIALNPMIKVIKPTESGVKVKKKKINFLDVDDINALYEESKRLNTEEFRINGAVDTPVYSIYAKGIILILYTGLRISEALALTWNDWDVENKTLSVDKNLVLVRDKNTGNKLPLIQDTTKTTSGKRIIPLADRAIEQLQYLKLNNKDKSPDARIFQSTTGKVPSQSNLTRTLSAMLLRSKSKIKKCGLHALRHSYGSMLLAQGIDLKTISHLLGHSDFRLTCQIYLDVTNKQLVDATDVLNKMN